MYVIVYKCYIYGCIHITYILFISMLMYIIWNKSYVMLCHVSNRGSGGVGIYLLLCSLSATSDLHFDTHVGEYPSTIAASIPWVNNMD